MTVEPNGADPRAGLCQACGSELERRIDPPMIRVLGPPDVTTEAGSLPIGGLKQRAVLAVIVAAGGLPVRNDRIVDAVYRGGGGASAHRIVHTYVSNLRRVLGDAIVGASGGYRFQPVGFALDADRFAELGSAARKLRGEDPERSVALCDAALGLWRGDPYEGLEDLDAVRPEIARLVEMKLAVAVLRSEIGLELGWYGNVVPDLVSLSEQHPLREDLVGLLMMALGRAGASAQALSVYARFEGMLWQEFGMQPSIRLQELADRLGRRGTARLHVTSAAQGHE